MLTIASQTNADSVDNLAVIRASTDSAAASAQTFVLGFTPRVVRVHNLTDLISDEWYEGMANASSLHTVAAGTRTLELVNGVVVSGTSITLTAATMAASKVFAIEALG